MIEIAVSSDLGDAMNHIQRRHHDTSS